MDNQRAASGLPFSEAVKAGQLVFLSGQIGIGGGAGTGGDPFELEVRQVMANLGEVLQRQGLHFGNLAPVSVKKLALLGIYPPILSICPPMERGV